ncbi:formyltransferase family protein [Crocosphaera sp.]|uniref:formyltransferase family protein n=1 Tax=Crocosphaera sp. TaxID=2729996 RepID=UPI00261EF8DA|nr:formyltransferase family protein [Crocosphaera sp.]MDJ0582495.1 formyltransferase family protein [Crocosphaera sp.]
MNSKKFYLVTDASIICSYLVSKWVDAFGNMPEFQGVIVKEEPQSQNVLKARQDFHNRYFDLNNFIVDSPQKIADLSQEIADLYPSFDQTEKSMITNYGVAKYSVTGYDKTFCLGDNLNGNNVKEWLIEVSEKSSTFIFVCATQILKSWWIELTNSQVFNCHSAVLPFARGMYAIENIAIQENVSEFKKAAGTTIHYIDEGVDTGKIIRAQRIMNPFQFDSIWDLKAYSYLLGFDLYVKTAQDILADSETIQVGISPNPELLGPNFLIKDFTPEKQRQAEQSYLSMKNSL